MDISFSYSSPLNSIAFYHYELSCKKSQNHFTSLVSSSPFGIIVSTKPGRNSTKNHQIYLISNSGTLTHKIFHCVTVEYLLKFSVRLSRQSLVAVDDQYRVRQPNNIFHGECLTATVQHRRKVSCDSFLLLEYKSRSYSFPLLEMPRKTRR